MNSKIVGIGRDVIHYYSDKQNKTGDKYAILLYILSTDSSVFGLKSKQLFIADTSPYFELFQCAICSDNHVLVDDVIGLSVDVIYNDNGYISTISFGDNVPSWISDYVKTNIVTDVDELFNFMISSNNVSSDIS